MRENQQCFAQQSPSRLISCAGRSHRTTHVTKRATIDRPSLAVRRRFPADRRAGSLAVAEGLNLAKYWETRRTGIIGLTAKTRMIYRLRGSTINATTHPESKWKKHRNVNIGTVQRQFLHFVDYLVTTFLNNMERQAYKPERLQMATSGPL